MMMVLMMMMVTMLKMMMLMMMLMVAMMMEDLVAIADQGCYHGASGCSVGATSNRVCLPCACVGGACWRPTPGAPGTTTSVQQDSTAQHTPPHCYCYCERQHSIPSQPLSPLLVLLPPPPRYCLPLPALAQAGWSARWL